jgi:hypothetical protein
MLSLNKPNAVVLKGEIMPQFLSLLESLATHVNAQNIEQFVSLVEGLVKLAESMKNPPATPPTTPTT